MPFTVTLCSRLSSSPSPVAQNSSPLSANIQVTAPNGLGVYMFIISTEKHGVTYFTPYFTCCLTVVNDRITETRGVHLTSCSLLGLVALV